jgi:hypothetical protein
VVVAKTLTQSRWLRTTGTWAVALALALWSVRWYVGFADHGAQAWRYFNLGGHDITDLSDRVHGGTHLYAGNPKLQIGPFALLAAAALRPFAPHAGLVAGQLLAVVAGCVIVWQVYALARNEKPQVARRRLLLATVPFIPVWMYLAARSEHLDDVLALLCATLAMRAARTQHAVACGVLIGLSFDAKPWALPFLCIALLLVDRRDQIRAAIWAVGVMAAGWLPFLIGDPKTAARLSHFTIVNSSYSALRVLGISNANTPSWDRPAQAALGAALALLAIRRGRWPAVILLIVITRIALDPSINRYYTAGIAVGALLWDVLGSRISLPLWSTVVLAMFGSRWVHLSAPIPGWIVLGFLVLAAGLLAVAPQAAPREPDVSDEPNAPNALGALRR